MPFVVLERADWVRVLEEVDYLRQDRAHLDQQLTVTLREVTVLYEQVKEQAALLETIEAQIEGERKKQQVLDQERQRLQAELDQQGFWSRVKDYGLVVLGTVAVLLAIL